MSKHISRKKRWTQESALRYSSNLGTVMYEKQAWYGLLEYKTLAAVEKEGGLATWLPQAARLGPFKRPRDAMVAVEREATLLKNRHGLNLLLGKQLWAET